MPNYTPEEIETSFLKLKARISSRTSDDTKDAYEKILTIMRNHKEIIWWTAGMIEDYAPSDLFIGYEVSARFSELAVDTTLLESRRCGKYMARRLLR